MPKHLLSLQDMPREDFLRLLARFANPSVIEKPSTGFKGRTVGLMFDRPSTRTRLSFYRAVLALGGFPVPLRTADLQLATGEDRPDTARMLPLYLDALVVRTRTIADLQVYSQQTQMPVINALTDEEHPTQAIADLLTIQDVLGTLDGARILFVGAGGNIAVSFLFACAMSPGISVSFLTPRSYPLPGRMLQKVARLGTNVLDRISELHDPRNLPSEIDVVYTTRWRSMGEEKEDADWRRHFQGFQVTSELLEAVGRTGPAYLMHDLPAEKGEEVEADLLDHERSLVVRQASNKTLAAQAALCWTLDIRS